MPTAMWLEFHHSQDPRLKIMINIMRIRTISEMETATRITLDNGDPYDVHEDYATVYKMLINAFNKMNGVITTEFGR